MLNQIYNEDCIETMKNMERNGVFCDVVLTSPPYNTGKAVKSNPDNMRNCDVRYDVFVENKTDEEYIAWTLDLFANIDKILSPNGVVLYNLSYSSNRTSNAKGDQVTDLMWRVVAAICEKTGFTVADRIVWKKKSAIPNNRSANKLTRICEDIFVFCRKTEYLSFRANKQVVSISGGKRAGQKNYEVIFNFVEAKNNDGSCPWNKATFSSELCEKLLSIYAEEGTVVYDPFMGSGTTALACKNMGLSYIGSEISEKQCEWAEKRINTSLLGCTSNGGRPKCTEKKFLM